MKQRFNPAEGTLHLMESFRRMTNDCIRIGLAERKTSLKSLSVACYPKLKTYGVSSAYKLCAISKAAGILNHYRKLSGRHHAKEPYCSRLSLTTYYGIRVIDGKVRMRGGIELPLNPYVQRFLSQPDIEVRSVTLTPESISVSVRKQVEPTAFTGMLGIDSNLDNVTLTDTQNQIQRFDISEASVIKARCRRNKRGFRRNDVKVKKRIFTKYGRLQRNRVGWLLHNVSSNIVRPVSFVAHKWADELTEPSTFPGSRHCRFG